MTMMTMMVVIYYDGYDNDEEVVIQQRFGS